MLDLARRVVELDAARRAREVVAVVHLAAVAQRLAVDHPAVTHTHTHLLQPVALHHSTDIPYNLTDDLSPNTKSPSVN